jgi:hypothetical protein
MPGALRDRLPGGAARVPSRRDSPQARQVLSVLEQDPAPATAGSAPGTAVGVDHRQAAFMAIHHSPGGALLIGYPAMMSSTPAFASAASRRSIETRPTSLPDSRPTTPRRTGTRALRAAP